MDQLTPLHDTFRPGTLKTTGLAEQYRRQRISNDWEPKGFERYQYQRALLRSMSVLGGPDDLEGASPERYRPTSPCQETPNCTCGRH
jgi:hypothetical protein